MNIIIVGCGKAGDTLAAQLSAEDNNVTVIDTNRSAVQAISDKYDVMGIAGNGTDHSVLEEAGVKGANLLIAVTGLDERNLLCCLIAKKAGNCQTIARIRDPEIHGQIRYIRDELGLAMVINPELAVAREISRILSFPSTVQIETFAKGRVEILSFRVPEGSVLHGLKVSEITTRLRCGEVLVCTVERGEEAIIPDGNFTLSEQDLVSIVASQKNAKQFFKRIGIQTNHVKDTIIIGGGRLCFYLARILLRTNIAVKIIEQDKARCEKLSELLPKATVLCGNGINKELLLEEGIERADSIVTLTGIDEENVLLSLFAKSRNSGMKVITKVNNIDFDEVLNSLDLDAVIYPKRTTSEIIVTFVRALKNSIGSNVETLHHIANDKVEALEFRIRENSSLLNIPLEKLKLKSNLLIGCINRENTIIFPKGQDVLMMGDTVVVVTTNKGLKDIKDILKD